MHRSRSESDDEGDIVYAWTVALDGVDISLLADQPTTSESVLAFVPETATGWAGGATYEFALTITRGARTASTSVRSFGRCSRS